MVSVIIAAHGHMAEGLLGSSAMIVGPSDDVVAVTFEQSEGPDDLLAKYAAAVEASTSEQHLILCDLFGGSPYNAAARFAAERPDADVVSGANLPMLVEVARTAGKAGIKILSEEFTPTTTPTISDDEGDEL